MRKLKDEWIKKVWYEKVLFVIGMVCSVSVIILSILQLCNVWADSVYVYMPMMAAVMLVQAFDNRKRSQGVMFLSLGTAAFISIVWFLILFVL